MGKGRGGVIRDYARERYAQNTMVRPLPPKFVSLFVCDKKIDRWLDCERADFSARGPLSCRQLSARGS